MGENMDNKTINIKNEAKNIAEKLDFFSPQERMSIFESDVEDLVKKFRNSLNSEIVENLNNKLSEDEAVVCKNGHSLYKYKSKKKTSF